MTMMVNYKTILNVYTSIRAVGFFLAGKKLLSPFQSNLHCRLQDNNKQYNVVNISYLLYLYATREVKYPITAIT